MGLLRDAFISRSMLKVNIVLNKVEIKSTLVSLELIYVGLES
jgi:hypothetical protein